MKNLVGYFGKNNCGDDALLLAAKRMFYPEPVKTFAPDEPGDLPDGAILGAGDVINPFFLQKFKGAKGIKILGTGLGYESEIDLLTEEGFVQEAFFRSKEDAAIALSKGINARATPDLAFSLDVPADAEDFFPKKDKKLLAVLVADNVSQSFAQTDIKQISYGNFLKSEIALALIHLRHDFKVIFLPMSHDRYAFDVKMCYEIMSYMPHGSLDYWVFNQPLAPLQALKVISEMDVVLSMRFHGLIFATLAGVPFVNIGLSRKNRMFASENALGDLSIPAFSATRDLILEKISLAQEDLIKLRVEHARDLNKMRLAETAAYLKEKW